MQTGENIATISFQQRSTQQTSEGAASSSHIAKLAVVPAILEQITTAELLQMLKVAKNDFSIASCQRLSDLFQKMFPGPETEGFALSRSKASYLTTDGLGPILTKHLMKEINITDSAFTLMRQQQNKSESKWILVGN